MKTLYQRRIFIAEALKISGALALLSIPMLGTGALKTSSTTMKRLSDADALPETVQDVIAFILQEIQVAPVKDTVDTLKCGNPAQVVTGIVTTMFPTVEIIEKAVTLKANFIIAHEPSFYNHTDDRNWVADNQVVKKKLALLDAHKIAIWRFHDYWHRFRPDGISHGVLKSAGWLPYDQEGKLVFTIPPMPLGALVRHLKTSLYLNHVRIIGDIDQVCSRIALMPGSGGGQRQIAIAETEHPDVLLVGETSEWETPEYIRDARRLGSKTALVILGHSLSEEPGMGWLAEWLQPKLPGLKITHIASNDPFTWM